MAIGTRLRCVWLAAATLPVLALACDLNPQPLPPDTAGDSGIFGPGGDGSHGDDASTSANDSGAFGDAGAVPPDAAPVVDGGGDASGQNGDAGDHADAASDAADAASDDAPNDAPTEGG
jgi:hypothetical protein